MFKNGAINEDEFNKQIKEITKNDKNNTWMIDNCFCDI